MSVEQAVQQLKPQFLGSVLTPSDEGYKSARKVYSGMIDKHPGAIAHCVDIADVIAAVLAALDQEVSDASIPVHQKYAERIPTGLSLTHLCPINGAVHRVDRADTAFSYRECLVTGVIAGIDPDPKNKESITNWTKEYFDALHPYSAGGAYVNFMMEEGQERVRASFGENHDRLAVIKRKYDPTNFFRVNQNIRPA